jgi:hypothetical protein
MIRRSVSPGIPLFAFDFRHRVALMAGARYALCYVLALCLHYFWPSRRLYDMLKVALSYVLCLGFGRHWSWSIGKERWTHMR